MNNHYNEFDKQTPTTGFYENIVEFSAGANFKITKNTELQGGYTRTVDMAPASQQLSYDHDVVFLGVNMNF